MHITASPAAPRSAGAIRARARREGIDAQGLGADPMKAFHTWHAEWTSTAPFDPAAMTLATVDQDGRPGLCVMDLVAADHGFIFMTHAGSAKGTALSGRAEAALCFAWLEAGRQVRVRGIVEELSSTEADRHFLMLPRPIRLVANATRQGAVIDSREVIEQRLGETRAALGDGEPGRPQVWRGYRLLPLDMEFWQQRPEDLQDRIGFRRASPAETWRSFRLSP